MPYDINLKRIHLYQGAASENISSRCAPEDGVILGSANGHEWHHVHTFTGLQYGGTLGSYSFDAAGESVAVNATTPYKHYALVTTRTLHYAFTVIIGELIWFGTPAPSTLDDGHLTLGKTLTTPRVSGHAAGAETPRAESLVVHYDTTVDSVKSGNTVVDTSGAGSNGTLTNGAAYSSSDRALTFDGTNDHMVGTINNPSGAWVHTVSVWFKNNTALNADFQYLHFIGSESTNKASAIQFATSSSTSIYVTFYGNYLYNSYNNVNLETVNEWRNITYSYEGGNTSTTNPKIYVDGKLTTGWTLAGGSSGTAPNLDANASIKLAGRPGNTQYFNGSISNFKIWGGVALTAAEVEAEYALGRTGKAINITDTAVCLGGTVPRAQLDVRGSALFQGVGIGNNHDSTHATTRGLSMMLEDATIDNTDAATIFDYPIQMHNTYPQAGSFAAGREIGLCFSLYDSEYPGDSGSYTPGAAITHERVSSWSQGKLHFKTKQTTGSNDNCTTAMTISENGNVGIGESNPSNQKLDINGGGLYIRRSGTHSGGRNHDANKWILLRKTGNKVAGEGPGISFQGSYYRTADYNNHYGMIQCHPPNNNDDMKARMVFYVNDGGGSGLGSSDIAGYFDYDSSGGQVNFTGQHRTFIKDIPTTQSELFEGLIVSANQNKYVKMNGGVEAGSNAVTINESLPIVSLSNVASDKKCFGVISYPENSETREDRYGRLFCRFKKEPGDTRVYINSAGEGAIWVTNANGPLESGDYITTSNVAGYGMRQDDDILHNYTVAKITMDCDFAPATQPVQQIVKELGNVNYWVETTYTDVALEEYSNLTEENRQTVTTTRYSNDDGDISPSEYNDLDSNAQATYSEIETVTYQHIERDESTDEQEGYTLEVREELVNVLDEHGQLQWEDHPTETEKAYKIRYLTADGRQTDEANAVHIAAFVGCTYHCG